MQLQYVLFGREDNSFLTTAKKIISRSLRPSPTGTIKEHTNKLASWQCLPTGLGFILIGSVRHVPIPLNRKVSPEKKRNLAIKTKRLLFLNRLSMKTAINFLRISKVTMKYQSKEYLP